MKTIGWGVLGLLAATAAVGAEPQARTAPHSGFYLQFGFGDAGPTALHYGLRLAPHAAALSPAALQLDLSARGTQALLGGLPLTARRKLVAGNDEAATVVEESAPETATETAPEAAVWYNPASWGLTQWGAVIGTGVLAHAYASDRQQSETPPPIARESATGDAPVDPCAPEGTPEIGGECLSDAGYTESHQGRSRVALRESSDWLDGGSGQMGDLLPARR